MATVGGGHQSQGTELAATADQATTLLTFPLAVGADVLVGFRVLIRARSASTRLVRAYLVTVVATRATGQDGSASGVLLNDLMVVSGADELSVNASLDGTGVTAGVVTVALTPANNGAPVTAITVQALFDALPAGAVVK